MIWVVLATKLPGCLSLEESLSWRHSLEAFHCSTPWRELQSGTACSSIQDAKSRSSSGLKAHRCVFLHVSTIPTIYNSISPSDETVGGSLCRQKRSSMLGWGPLLLPRISVSSQPLTFCLPSQWRSGRSSTQYRCWGFPIALVLASMENTGETAAATTSWASLLHCVPLTVQAVLLT